MRVKKSVAVCYISADAGEFDTQYGHSDDYSLADALWICSNMFAKAYVVTIALARAQVTSLVFSIIYCVFFAFYHPEVTLDWKIFCSQLCLMWFQK